MESISIFLRTINVSTNNNLAITFAACYAGHFLSSIDLARFSPFSCFVSTLESVKEGELETDFIQFFETFFSTTDFSEAVRALNISNKNPYKYYLLSAEDFYEKAIKKLLDEHYNPKIINYKNRVNNIVRKVLKLKALDPGENRKDLKKKLHNYFQKERLTLRDEYRSIFLGK